MRGQIWNCKKIQWTIKGKKESVNNCLLVFVCFEKGDTQKTILEAVRRIEQLNKKRYSKQSIIIFPFSHLSSKILPPDKARKLAKLMFERVNDKVKNTKELPFNMEKELIIHLLSKNEDVSYFEY